MIRSPCVLVRTGKWISLANSCHVAAGHRMTSSVSMEEVMAMSQKKEIYKRATLAHGFKPLRTLFGVDRNEARKLRRCLKEDVKDKEFLTQTAEQLKNLGVSKEDILSHPQILLKSGPEIEWISSYMKESGIRCDISSVMMYMNCYNVILKKSVPFLKAAGLVPENTCIPSTILLNAKIQGKAIPMFEEDLPLEELHWRTALLCLEEVFGTHLSSKQKMKLDTHLSITNALKVLSVLEEEVGLPRQTVLESLEVLCVCPSTLLKLLNGNYILPLDIQKLLHKYPNVALLSHSHIDKVLNVLDKHNFTEDDVYENPRVLATEPEKVDVMLQHIQKIPELKPTHHLKLVSKKNIQHKLSYLKLKNLVDQCSHGFSNHFCCTPIKTIRYLPELLERELHIPRATIRSELKNHSMWLSTNPDSVLSTLAMLRVKGFTDKEISENLILLLYPKSYVEMALNTHIFRDRELQSNNLYFNRRLALCLYYIEKSNHFTWKILNQDLLEGTENKKEEQQEEDSTHHLETVALK